MNLMHAERLAKEIERATYPLSLGVYVADWRSRIVSIKAMGDRLRSEMLPPALDLIELHVPAFARIVDLGTPKPMDSDEAQAKEILKYNVPYTQLSGVERASYAAYCDTLDEAEKVVISSMAYAITSTRPTLEALPALVDILYEEAAHLEAVSVLLGLDQASRSWISARTLNNWDIVRRLRSIDEYLLVEHGLIEGRGSIAAARGVFDLVGAGLNREATAVMGMVAEEEANHALKGFSLLTRFTEHDAEPEMRAAVANFLRDDPIQDAGSFRSRRQMFALHLLNTYLHTRDVGRVRDVIMENVTHVATCGETVVTLDVLSNSVRAVVAWASIN